MTFQQSCRYNKDKKPSDIKEPSDIVNYERVNSLNKKVAKIQNDTKHLIVGTLTPFDGREYGYFYGANNQNQIMPEILDYVLGTEDRLIKLYKALHSKPKDHNAIKAIDDFLKEHGVAFLDVIDVAVSSKSNPSDNALTDFCLDYDSFKNIKEDVIIIANSRNAENALNIIQKENGTTMKVHYASQCKRKKGGLDSRKKEWKDQW